MTLRGLASLAKILEEAANPNSEVREDRPKRKALKKAAGDSPKRSRAIDPKRKAWYDRRLKEAAAKKSGAEADKAQPAEDLRPTQQATKTVASQLGGSLMQTLAAAKGGAKPKAEQAGGKRTEAWRRKPGEPIF